MLILAIETSAARYGLALGEEGRVRAEVTRAGEGRDLGDMLREALAATGAAVADIGAVAADIGPGSLGSLRDGVAFANGLAYALRVPVYSFSSFELLAAAVGGDARLPVLCTRRANDGLAYVGLVKEGRLAVLRHGRLEEIAPHVAGAHDALALAGSFRDVAIPGVQVFDTGVEAPEARMMVQIGLAGRAAGHPLTAPVFPITEQDGRFRG